MRPYRPSEAIKSMPKTPPLSAPALNAKVRALHKGHKKAPSISSRVAAARELMRENAEAYVNAHLEAVEGALKKDNFEVATKASQWALEHVEDIDEAGKEIRIVGRGVDREIPALSDGFSHRPQILIGINNIPGLPFPISDGGSALSDGGSAEVAELAVSAEVAELAVSAEVAELAVSAEVADVADGADGAASSSERAASSSERSSESAASSSESAASLDHLKPSETI
jgi:hypothetical protein